MSDIALKTFDIENDIVQLSPQDNIYKFDREADRQLNRDSPWSKDPHYFKSCKISAVALIKMVMHARSGVPYEIMGMLQGKVVGTSLVILDSFALPVQGTETRVNAGAEATEYMVAYYEGSQLAGRPENLVGWYHSHPGYGCWLSGIDVSTQMNNQKHTDPFVAVVVDPNRTMTAGKVDIGAFRTYPENYTPPNVSSSEYQSIPLSKIEDFGVHANQYYPLEVEIFKSSLETQLLDLLWNKYWVNTLSQSPLISNRAYAVSQLADLNLKLSKVQQSIATTKPTLLVVPTKEQKDGKQKEKEETKKKENELAKSVKDSTKIAAEAQHGLIAQVIKDVIFSIRPGSGSGSGQRVVDTSHLTESMNIG